MGVGGKTVPRRQPSCGNITIEMSLDELQLAWRRLERRLRDPRVVEVIADPGLAIDTKADFADKAHLQPVYA